MSNDSIKNAGRFNGFADLYNDVRPRMPLYPVQVITRYLGHPPRHVVDMGCGPGLSTLVWGGHCDRITGIEPGEDMFALAKTKANDHVSFIQAYSHDTGLESNCAEAVVFSQSFHWMEPVSTLAEVNRILAPGGVFATVDCDWPPVCDWQAEKAYLELFAKVEEAEKNLGLKNVFTRWDKNHHLANIRASGHFRYAREIVFSHAESCTADRLLGLALSQGGLQAVLRADPSALEKDLEAYQTTLQHLFGDKSFEISFCYRMRIGVK